MEPEEKQLEAQVGWDRTSNTKTGDETQPAYSRNVRTAGGIPDGKLRTGDKAREACQPGGLVQVMIAQASGQHRPKHETFLTFFSLPQRFLFRLS